MTHIKNKNVDNFHPKSGRRKAQNKDMKTHPNSLVTLWYIWKELYKMSPECEVQSKKLAYVMQSFNPERNNFYSYYVYVYMSNFHTVLFGPLCENTRLNFHIILLRLLIRTTDCIIFTGILDTWNPRIPRQNFQFNQEARKLELHIFCRSSL